MLSYVRYTSPMDTDIRVSEFQDREALDSNVQVRIATSGVPEALRIVGTREELARLHLSHGLSVFGVPAVAIDHVPVAPVERPARGPIKPFGINGNLRDRKGKSITRKSK